MKAAVIFHRLGPYHFARLRAVGRLLPLTVIETSGVDETYAWDSIGEVDGFERVTLFGNADAHKQPSHEVSRLMLAALDKIQPQIVVTPGWSDPAALAAIKWSLKQGVPVVCMSESTEWDAERGAWREAMKRRIVGLCSAALVGGRPHKEYMVKLGMPAERIFLGYDAVDNAYFAAGAAKWRKQKIENRNQKSEGKNQFQLSLAREMASPISPGSVSAFQDVSVSAFQNAPFFLASARFIEKKNLPRLLKAFSRYRELAGASVKRCDSASVEQVDGNSGELDTGSPVHLNPEKLKHQTETPKHRNTDLRPLATCAARRWPFAFKSQVSGLKSWLAALRAAARLQAVSRVAGLLRPRGRVHSRQHNRAMGSGGERGDGERPAGAGFQPLRLRVGLGSRRREWIHLRSIRCGTTRAVNVSGLRFRVSGFKVRRRESHHYQ